MKRIQISHNVIDLDILNEVKKYLLAPWQTYLLFGTTIVAFIAAVFNFYANSYIGGIVLIALGIISFVEVFWSRNRRIKEMKKLMQEETGKTENVYTLLFTNQGLTIRNCDMGTDNRIAYEDMTRFVETQHTYMLFGKKNQFAIIRKDCLKVSFDEFVTFLQDHQVKIKTS